MNSRGMRVIVDLFGQVWGAPRLGRGRFGLVTGSEKNFGAALVKLIQPPTLHPLGTDGVPYPALPWPSGASIVEKPVSSPPATPPQIASLTTTAAMEVAAGAPNTSGRDRLTMGSS